MVAIAHPPTHMYYIKIEFQTPLQVCSSPVTRIFNQFMLTILALEQVYLIVL